MQSPDFRTCWLKVPLQVGMSKPDVVKVRLVNNQVDSCVSFHCVTVFFCGFILCRSDR